jgi:hypothetical protein
MELFPVYYDLNVTFRGKLSMAKSSAQKSRRVTPWDGEQDLSTTQAFLKRYYDSHYKERHGIVGASGEAGMINSYRPAKCPYCGSEKFRKRGLTGSGIQRYLCECGKAFLSTTGTIFDDRKISISEWMEYCLNLFRHVSINADSWNNRNAFTTSRYWLEKLFLVLESYRSSLEFSNPVWLDETFYSVKNSDIVRTQEGNKLRGLSSNQMCIGVVCDKTHTLCVFEGYGKPSQKKTYEAFKDHIVAGSTLIHDSDNAHEKLVKELKLNSIAYDSRKLKLMNDKDNPLNRVNRIHYLLKAFLYAHTSFNRDKIQGYLNLFSFVMNPPVNHLEKLEILLDLAIKNPRMLRYRDFFAVK